MPKGYAGAEYGVKSSGTNSQGNHWCSRDYGPSAPNQNPYHYSNKDGSYHYSNPDGSTYHNDGKGMQPIPFPLLALAAPAAPTILARNKF